LLRADEFDDDQNGEDDRLVAADDERPLVDNAATSPSPVATSPATPTPPSAAVASTPEPPPRAATPKFQRLPSADTADNHKCLEIGSLVELKREKIDDGQVGAGEEVFGVVRWVGWLPECDRSGVGVELVRNL